MKIGTSYLNKMRRQSNITIKQLSGITGIDPKLISEMEDGKRPITEKYAKLFTKVLPKPWKAYINETILEVPKTSTD